MTETVTITKADWVERDEVYTDWYRCRQCGCDWLEYEDNFCAKCGIRLAWDVNNREEEPS